MIKVAYLGLLSLLFRSSASDYGVDSLYGRTFNPFSYLTRYTSGWTDLTAKVSAMDTRMTQVSDQVTALTNQLATLRLGPKCPLTAPPGSRVVGNHCYSVVANPAANFATAISNCNLYGGYLAEPFPQTSAIFYAAMRAAFPQEMRIIDGNQNGNAIWVGAHQVAGNNPIFFFLSNNVAIPQQFFTGLPSGSAAALGASGTMWTGLEPIATMLPYICQFNTVL